MIFTSLKFILFMGVVFALYYTLPKKNQWKLLLAASYVFYAFASPVFLVFLLATTVITYAGTNLMEKNAGQKKPIMIVTAVLVLGMLVVFKYAAFMLENFSLLLGIFGIRANFPTLRLILPIGLSFYIFQSLGYCVDVYRELVAAEKNFFKHALYVSFFPQLLQGPIGDYSRLGHQLFEEHSFSRKESVFGVQRAAWGFFKKLVVANQISVAIDSVWGQSSLYSGFVFWLFMLALYAIQLYADFSGYMDIALGCAQTLGISMDENFDTPYLSKSVAEFWRRWHITLGAWFKNYVFYPVLRSNFVSDIRKKWRKSHPYLSNSLTNIIALSVVWFLTGLWHGADWGYVAWGMYYFVFLALSVLLAPLYAAFYKRFPTLEQNKAFSVFRIARTFVIVILGYAFFRPANLSVSFEIFAQMTRGLGVSALLDFALTNLKQLFAAFVGIAALLFVDIYHFNQKEISLRQLIAGKGAALRWFVYIAFVASIIILGVYARPELNQFAYFRF